MEMKVKITTSIDSYLKSSFESTAKLHKKTFSDLVEAGIKQILAEVSPLEFLKLEIAQAEQDLSDMRSRVAEIEVLEAQKKQIARKPIHDESAFSGKREELFKTGPGTLINQLKRNQTPAWSNVYLRYGFSSSKDMEVYVIQEAAIRGLI